jgi:bla regulator protein BlaR1
MVRFGFQVVAVLLGAVVPVAVAQSGALAFDVATVKPHPGWPDRQAGLHYHADGITAELTLWQLVGEAYKVYSPGKVTGAPDWAQSVWYDVEAKMSDADIAEMKKLSSEESKKHSDLMLQALLAERFKLKVHSETKQVPVYDLVVAKSSAKLRDAATDKSPLLLGKKADGTPDSGLQFKKDTSIGQHYSMQSLAGLLSQPVSGVGRPVVDKTGLTSTYNFTLNWSIYSARPPMASAGGGEAAAPDDSTSIFAALGEIGLKLVPSKGEVKDVVIDHVERPTAN